MRKIEILFEEYGESHKNETNKLIHWICVPLIFWSILGFVSIIPSPHFVVPNIAAISLISLIGIVLITLFYLRLSWKIAVIMLVAMFMMEYFAYLVNIKLGHQSWMLFLAVFILSWIGQFYGHKIEGKKPSFLKDLQFLLVGPAWLLSFILKKIGITY